MIIWTLATGNEASLDHGLTHLASRVLSEDELARAQRFQFEADRNRFVLAHALCRLMLSSEGDYEPSYWEFNRERYGRPYVVNASFPMDFNLSHTNGMVGCALSPTGRVGFDLEYRRRSADIRCLAEKKFAPGESEDVLSLSNEEQRTQFFRYWTLKEAYIKVTGRGLREALDSFCFDLSDTHPVCQQSGQDPNQYKFGLFTAGLDHQAAWALEISDDRGQVPEIHSFSLEDFQDMLV